MRTTRPPRRAPRRRPASPAHRPWGRCSRAGHGPARLHRQRDRQPAQDLILTAAHCVSGTAAGWQFAPGYNNGATPTGCGPSSRAYVGPPWEQRSGHPARLRDPAGAPTSDNGHRTSGCSTSPARNILGLAPRAGARITDIAYNAGMDDQPIHCTVPVYYTDGYPGFNCHGYVGGSSGSPWLARCPAPGHCRGRGPDRRPAPGRLLRVHLLLLGVPARHLPGAAAGRARRAVRTPCPRPAATAAEGCRTQRRKGVGVEHEIVQTPAFLRGPGRPGPQTHGRARPHRTP